MATNMKPGGWSDFGPIDAESKAVFDKAMAGLRGVQYTPREVSKQLVAGTNYRFKCDAMPMVLEPQPYQAMVEIYQPLEGDPTITEINPILESETLPGGWTPFRLVDPELRQVLEEALQGLLGVSYEPLAVSTQVVQGVNCMYFCNATVVYPGLPSYPTMVTVHKPLKGKPHVTKIRRIC